MYQLSCADGYEYPGGDSTYVLEIIPLNTGLAATSSDQRLCIFDPLKLSQGPLKSIQTNHGNLTSAKAYNASDSIVVTAGENGTASVWDLRLDPASARALQIRGEFECSALGEMETKMELREPPQLTLTRLLKRHPYSGSWH